MFFSILFFLIVIAALFMQLPWKGCDVVWDVFKKLILVLSTPAGPNISLELKRLYVHPFVTSAKTARI